MIGEKLSKSMISIEKPKKRKKKVRTINVDSAVGYGIHEILFQFVRYLNNSVKIEGVNFSHYLKRFQR